MIQFDQSSFFTRSQSDFRFARLNGPIYDSQIVGMASSKLIGQVDPGQISAVNASSIIGSFTLSQLGSIPVSSLSGQLIASQISSVNSSSLLGPIGSANIVTLNAALLAVTGGGFTDSHIGGFDANKIKTGIITLPVTTTVGFGANAIVTSLRNTTSGGSGSVAISILFGSGSTSSGISFSNSSIKLFKDVSNTPLLILQGSNSGILSVHNDTGIPFFTVTGKTGSTGFLTIDGASGVSGSVNGSTFTYGLLTTLGTGISSSSSPTQAQIVAALNGASITPNSISAGGVISCSGLKNLGIFYSNISFGAVTTFPVDYTKFIEVRDPSSGSLLGIIPII